MTERNELTEEANRMTLAELLSRKARCQRLHDSGDDCHTFIADELARRLKIAQAMMEVGHRLLDIHIGDKDLTVTGDEDREARRILEVGLIKIGALESNEGGPNEPRH